MQVDIESYRRMVRSDRTIAQWVRRERVNRKHAQSLLSGKAGGRIEGLTENQLVAAMVVFGPALVCRVVKASDNEQEYHENLRKAAA